MNRKARGAANSVRSVNYATSPLQIGRAHV